MNRNAHGTKGACRGDKINLLALIPKGLLNQEKVLAKGSFLTAKIIQGVFFSLLFLGENVSPHFSSVTCEESKTV